MKDPQDRHWRNLVALSAPTFLPDPSPPYGFSTRVLAQLRADAQQRLEVERIGLRALFASLAILLVALGITFGSEYFTQGDLEPGLSNIVQVADVQVS